jgi:hypothetical protein
MVDLPMFVRPSVTNVSTQMPRMDFFNITYVFMVSVRVDARHFRFESFQNGHLAAIYHI